jgi:MFS family permease
VHQCKRSITPMNAISSTPGARRLLFISIVARLPLTMLSIGLLVHAEHISGSFAAAGVVAAAYAVSLGVGGPLLGALVDRRGQTVVLVASALAAAVVLVALALLPIGTPLPLLVGLTLLAGLATPPVGASVRALFPELLDDADVRAAYAVDASAVELTWISGPPLALGLGALVSTGAAMAAAGAAMLLGTAAFVAQPGSRNWRPSPGAERQPGGSLGAPGMRTLVSALLAVGVLFGAVEAALLLARTTVAPTYSSLYAMVEEVAPAGTVTEAFAWLATAAAIGSAAGAAAAGPLAERVSPTAAFVLAAGAGAVALVVAALRARTLAPLRAALAPTC